MQLMGPRGAKNIFTLQEGQQFHSKYGVIEHKDIIGKPEGSNILSQKGVKHIAMRPLLQDFALSMKRGPNIIYPKDAAQILAMADIASGMRVLEAGAGSGALSIWILRAVGSDGSLTSFEEREDHAAVARQNVAEFFDETPKNWKLHVTQFSDSSDFTDLHLPTGYFDRIILDMLAPWECVRAASTLLRPGGVLCVYVTTTTQLSRVVECIRDTGRFIEPQSSESILRFWHVDALSVRPSHRSLGHTGFIVVSRLLVDCAVPLVRKSKNKGDIFAL